MCVKQDRTPAPSPGSVFSNSASEHGSPVLHLTQLLASGTFQLRALAEPFSAAVLTASNLLRQPYPGALLTQNNPSINKEELTSS